MRRAFLFSLILLVPIMAAALPQVRIISLAPDITEILFELGVSDSMVATVDHSDYPKEAQALPRVGSFITPHIEKILLLKPTLVLGRTQATPIHVAELLQKRGIQTTLFSANNESDIFKTIKTLGDQLHKKSRAKALIQKMKHSLKSVKNRTLSKKVRILVLIEEVPLMVAGTATLIDRAIVLAGGINVASAYSGYPKLQKETILSLKPDLILIPVTAGQERKFRRMATTWKLFSSTHLINGDWVSRATPRFTKGVQTIATLIDQHAHP